MSENRELARDVMNTPAVPEADGGNGAPPRRRSERSRRAILEATRQLLVERGFEALTIEGIAATAGVGKQTIYRWWRNRTALVADVLADDAVELIPQVGADGDVIDDLVDWSGRIADAMTDEHGQVTMRTLSAAALEDEATAERFRAGLSDPLRAAARDRLAAAPQSIAPDIIEATVDAVVGGLVFAALLNGDAYRRDEAELLTRIAVSGALAVSATSTNRE